MSDGLRTKAGGALSTCERLHWLEVPPRPIERVTGPTADRPSDVSAVAGLQISFRRVKWRRFVARSNGCRLRR